MIISGLEPEDSCSLWKHSVKLHINKLVATGSTCLKHSRFGVTEFVWKLHQYSKQQRGFSVQ